MYNYNTKRIGLCAAIVTARRRVSRKYARPTVSFLGAARNPHSEQASTQHSQQAHQTVASRPSRPTDTCENHFYFIFRHNIIFCLRFRRLPTTTVSLVINRRVTPRHMRDGPSAPVAASAAAGRGLCLRGVSDERFQTGARKRLPGERRTVGRGTEKVVSAGRVPSAPGRRLRPVHVRNGSVHTQVLPEELGVRRQQMHGTQRIARRQV